MKNIEVEIRSFIDEKRFLELLEFFKSEAKYLGEGDQTTYYFDCSQDLRIQKNNNFAKIWLKSGKIHDEAREEIEVRFKTEDFKKLENLFLSLGYKVEIKWFRKRHSFDWKGINVSLDFTKGYGYIIELEKLSTEKEKEDSLRLLKEKLLSLDIPLTPKKEFDQKYDYYRKNWQKLLS